MKNYKNNLLESLFMLRDALKDYDIELSHNILIGGGTDKSEEEMEQDIEDYLEILDDLIQTTKSSKFNF